MSNVAKIDRRDFIRLGGIAGGGLVIGVYGGSEAVGQMLATHADGGALDAVRRVHGGTRRRLIRHHQGQVPLPRGFDPGHDSCRPEAAR